MGLPETHISWGTAVLKRTQHRLNLFDPVVITTIIRRMIVSASYAGWGRRLRDSWRNYRSAALYLAVDTGTPACLWSPSPRGSRGQTEGVRSMECCCCYFNGRERWDQSRALQSVERGLAFPTRRRHPGRIQVCLGCVRFLTGIFFFTRL